MHLKNITYKLSPGAVNKKAVGIMICACVCQDTNTDVNIAPLCGGTICDGTSKYCDKEFVLRYTPMGD
jgi:hypothetical protein